ncbi:MAG: GNAT family N-acetyltransferase [Oscillospiraceae bacterium]|jgi:ribosomal protein S18 acetylase RimI-like enzyme|nr:GNAT family N-acetyltransferase [Oscillospiraceae bacterium]
MQPEFAPIQSSDIEPLFGLCKALIDQYEDTARIDYPAVLGWTRRKLERQISEYRRILWDGQHVGYLHFAPSQGQMELDDFYIFPEFQHRGIGSAVLRLLREETELPIFLYVFLENEGALRLYHRLGFREVQRVDGTRCIMTWRKEP